MGERQEVGWFFCSLDFKIFLVQPLRLLVLPPGKQLQKSVTFLLAGPFHHSSELAKFNFVNYFPVAIMLLHSAPHNCSGASTAPSVPKS